MGPLPEAQVSVDVSGLGEALPVESLPQLCDTDGRLRNRYEEEGTVVMSLGSSQLMRGPDCGRCQLNHGPPLSCQLPLPREAPAEYFLLGKATLRGSAGRPSAGERRAG